MAILETYGPHGQGMPLMLDSRPDEIVIGSKEGCDIVVEGDPAVSRVHARLERRVSVWSIADCGARNGTFVNGVRISQERRLQNGDAITMGNSTKFVFRDAKVDTDTATAPAAPKPRLTPTEREVLKELVRPWFEGQPFSPVASVEEIAARRFTGDGAVKNCLGSLYDKFGVPPVDPDNKADRRTRLAQMAMQAGVIGLHEYADDPG
jgi:pSer/pThr/pTyr-binding forkhead associated (FHA) protein